MARLVRLRDRCALPVPARCLIGRAPICTLPIDDEFASSEHAKLQWSGGHWELRDLGSRNGTFVDGQRLEPGHLQPLSAGAKIGFGQPEASYVLEDDREPFAFAINQTTQALKEASDGILALPSDDAPILSCYRDPNGTGWVSESADGAIGRIEDQAVLVVGAQSWRVALPLVGDATPMVDVAFALPNVSFRFCVPPSEERVEISVSLRGKETWLEPREHGYLLLMLARAREQTKTAAIDHRGWVPIDALVSQIKADENAINVLTHRARRQLAAIGLEGAAGIVETRRGSRRLGTDRFTIEAVPG